MRRVFKGVAWLVIFGVLAIGIVLAALWFEHRAAVALPAPTGSFAVGRATYVWTDGTPDTLAPAPGINRELLVWMWCPGGCREIPCTGRELLARPVARGRRRRTPALITRFLTRDLSKVHAHSLGNADVAQPQRPYPVVIFQSGRFG